MAAARLALLALFAAVSAASLAEPATLPALLARDDACLAGDGDFACDLNALQQSARLRGPAIELVRVPVKATATGHATANLTAEQFPTDNIRNAISRVGDVAQAAIDQAAQAVGSTIAESGNFTNGLMDGVINQIGDATHGYINSSTVMVKGMMEQATEAAAKAGVTIPGLSTEDIDAAADMLTDTLTEAQGVASGMSRERLDEVREQMQEAVLVLNSTVQLGEEDAEEAAAVAAEQIAASMNSTFEQLAPEVQEEILKVLARVAVQAESLQKAAIDLARNGFSSPAEPAAEERSAAPRALPAAVALLAALAAAAAAV